MPTFWLVFGIIGFVRVVGTMYYQLVTDCDQTFNYEEPTHYMLYGTGLQTWEYAPQYALRSYAYTGIHALIGWAVGAAWAADKIAVFHRIHIVLALTSALCESLWVVALARRVSPRLAWLTMAGLVASAGMLHAAPAYLPSTFTMCGLLLSWSFWLRGQLGPCIFSVVVALGVGWPFAVVAVVPMGIHILLHHSLIAVIAHSIWSLVVVCGACILTDFHFYGKWVLAPWNIILYNAFGVGGGGHGSNLYGEEPASFYALNLVLNFNVQAVAAAVSPIALVWLYLRRSPQSSKGGNGILLAHLAQLWVWFCIMSSRPHKEERFMFVVFPLISLASGVCVDAIATGCAALASGTGSTTTSSAPSRSATTLRRLLTLSFFLAAVALSASRIHAVSTGFSTPFAAWSALARHLQRPSATKQTDVSDSVETVFGHKLHVPGVPGYPPLNQPSVLLPSDAKYGQLPTQAAVRVCVGKEWYRFPSAFFLPDSVRDGLRVGRAEHQGAAELAFIKSAFGGQLPQPFLPGGTNVTRTGFNDMNAEEVDRYVPLATCDYVVDFELPTPRSQQDAQYDPYLDSLRSPQVCVCDRLTWRGSGSRWISIWSASFLHADSTPSLARAFTIPGYSESRRVYGTYHVLQQLPCACRP